MFIVGTIIFVLYMVGYLIMITKMNKLQDKPTRETIAKVKRIKVQSSERLVDVDEDIAGEWVKHVRKNSKKLKEEV